MRIRRKKWAPAELAAAPYHIDTPAQLRGCWPARFARPEQPLHVELGCGKGAFISVLAAQCPQVNFLAVDKISNMLGLCKRAVESIYHQAGRKTDNILLAAWDIERIEELLAPEDGVERLYINFCNPWPKERHKKHRLTHVRQLLHYSSFLSPGAEIFFKTDDDALFEESHDYLRQAGFTVVHETWDLHGERGFIPESQALVATEHEQMFIEQGVAIKFLRARMEPR